jgi:putative protease
LIEEKIVEAGSILHFFSKINVAVVELSTSLSVGDQILIKGPSTDFEQIVESIQIEHKNLQKAEKGQSIGLKMAQQAKEKDVIYKKL